MEAPSLKVPIKIGEKMRRELLRMSALDLDLRVRSDKEHIFLPLKEGMDIKKLLKMGEIIKIEFEPVSRPPKTYKDLANIPEDMKTLLPSSFDVIGEIAIMKIPVELIPFEKEIGRAMLNVNRNIKTVCRDEGVKGEFRIRDLKFIYGDQDIETIHVENNLRFKLDPSRVYFSPRLANERMRVAEAIKGGRVLDMFAGVGPFSLTIARYGQPDEVVGIDLNPFCIEYFRSNILLNSSQDIVESYLGDAIDAPLGMGIFDHVIMNLPHGALDFLETALNIMEEGKIYLYTITGTEELKENFTKIMEISERSDKKVEIIGIRDVHNYSPTMSMMAIDLSISPST